MAKAKILTNTLYQLGAKIVSTFSTLFITVILTRSLGSEVWGNYAIVVSYITFFYIFTEFGVNSIAVKYFSEKGTIYKNDFISFLITRFLFTVITLLLALFLLFLFNYPKQIVDSILFLFIALLFFSLGSSFNAIYQAKLLYKNLFIATCFYTVVNVAVFLIILSIYKTPSFLMLFIPLVVAEIFRFLISAFLAKKHIINSEKYVFNKKLILFFTKASIPLGLAIAFNTLMTQVDKLMLSKMVSSVDMGYYALSYKIFDLVLVLPTFFMNAIFVLLATNFVNKSKYNIIYSKAYIYLGLASIFITIIFLSLGSVFIPRIWGVSMLGTVHSFNILILFTVFFYLSSPVSWIYVIENKQHILIIFYSLGFILNFGLNLIFIPIYGYIGSAYVTGITEILILFLLEIYRIKYLKVKFLYKYTLVFLKETLSSFKF